MKSGKDDQKSENGDQKSVGDQKSGKCDQRSPFAAALARLLDETELLTRQQWAELLDVSTAAISQWVNDKTIPRPEVLRMLIDALEESEQHRVLGEFKEITRRPAIEVSPNGERMGPSVGHYVVKPLLDGFLRNLDSLDFEKQEQILYRAAELCRQTQAGAGGLADATRDRLKAGLQTGDSASLSTERGDQLPMSPIDVRATGAPTHDPERAAHQREFPASAHGGDRNLTASEVVKSPAEPGGLTDTAAISTTLNTALDDDAEDEDSVTKTLVVNGEKQARLVKLFDRYRGLRVAAQNGEATATWNKMSSCSVGGAHFEVVGKFYLDDQDNLSIGQSGQGAASCVVVLWSFQAGENSFDPFPLDEMMFYPLRGEFEWRYEGDVDAVRLRAGAEHSDLMWMTAGKYRGPDRGLPPCLVTASEGAIGLGVFYSKHGVELCPAEGRLDLKDPRVEFESMKWSPATIREFWASFRASDSPLRNRLPFVALVPVRLGDLAAFVEANKIPVNPDRKVKHDPARSRGQFSDARLRSWDDWKDAVLFPRIVKFHAWPPDKEGGICMDHHTGREIIVPLGGAFKCLYANLEPEDTELYELRSADLKDKIKRRYVRSAEVSGQDYSDILLLCSNSAHGFSGIEGEDSYCLHIACRAYPHGIPQPRRRKSESGDSREGLRDSQRRSA